ncbi:MAG: dTDP-4-dehydrorhamnose 3,5-epimerase family protein [Anderseniella sp.]
MSRKIEVIHSTLEAALSDGALVTSDGTSLAKVPDGSISHASKTHVDDRGTVTELFDTRWNWHPDPIEFVYTYTIREGHAKGWGLHKEHEDRYFLIHGRMQIVCYDIRPDSPTFQQITHIHLSPENPRIVSIPTYVWHANLNIGAGEVRVVNFPTKPYEHANPDKLRLPLDTPEIPYSISGLMGW